MKNQTPARTRLTMLSWFQASANPHGWISTRVISAPAALAMRSTVTSTNGFTSWRSSDGSGRNSTSRVVLSTVYRND